MPKTLADLAEKMRDIDFTMLSTHSRDGGIASRPMSNNRDVDYDGDSWFFTTEDAQMVGEIAANANVGLTLQGKAGVLGMRPFFIAIDGKAELVRDRALFEEHWTKDLERWWPEGTDTPGLLLIKVHADRLHYWDGEDEGEVRV
jgi:general stress protein 26